MPCFTNFCVKSSMNKIFFKLKNDHIRGSSEQKCLFTRIISHFDIIVALVCLGFLTFLQLFSLYSFHSLPSLKKKKMKSFTPSVIKLWIDLTYSYHKTWLKMASGILTKKFQLAQAIVSYGITHSTKNWYVSLYVLI